MSQKFRSHWLFPALVPSLYKALQSPQEAEGWAEWMSPSKWHTEWNGNATTLTSTEGDGCQSHRSETSASHWDMTHTEKATSGEEPKGAFLHILTVSSFCAHCVSVSKKPLYRSSDNGDLVPALLCIPLAPAQSCHSQPHSILFQVHSFSWKHLLPSLTFVLCCYFSNTGNHVE